MKKIELQNANKCEYKPYYSNKEQSFFTLPSSPCDYSVVLGNSQLCLDISATDNIICSLNGYSRRKSWVEKKLDLPSSKPGRLIFNSTDEVALGVGIEYIMGTNIYFDSNSNIICICEDIQQDFSNFDTIEFNDNTYLTLSNNQIVSVWIKPEFM
ncbi:MAG: hypothetical protein PUE08_07325 [Eubacteriales bacterium]|nr:hypothetical protein [Eubacteriales bacterium]